MSELEKLKRQYAELVKKQTAVSEELQEVTMLVGSIARLSHADPEYSSAKFQNAQRDRERLLKQRDDLQAEIDDLLLKIRIAEIQHTPAEAAAMKAQVAKDERIKKLEGELEWTRHVLAERKANLAKAVFDGNDPAVLVGEIAHLQNRETGLLAGLAYK